MTGAFGGSQQEINRPRRFGDALRVFGLNTSVDDMRIGKVVGEDFRSKAPSIYAARYDRSGVGCAAAAAAGTAIHVKRANHLSIVVRTLSIPYYRKKTSHIFRFAPK